VFAECFASHRVVGSGGGGGVQRKAVSGSAESLGILEVAARAQADGVFLEQCGTGGDATQGGGHGEFGERRLGVGEGFVGGDRVVLDDTFATQQPQDANARDLQEVRDVGVGQAR